MGEYCFRLLGKSRVMFKVRNRKEAGGGEFLMRVRFLRII